MSPWGREGEVLEGQGGRNGREAYPALLPRRVIGTATAP